jgi:hypothetical protein
MALKVEAIKDAKVLAALQKFMTKERNVENFAFYFDKGNNEALYTKYVKSGAAKEVNLPAKIKNPLDALASLKNWNGMTPGIKAAKDEIKALINSDVMPRFERSPEYAPFKK